MGVKRNDENYALEPPWRKNANEYMNNIII